MMVANVTIRTDIGGSDFPALIEKGAYYVDKTRFIRDIFMIEGSRALLFTRPRRFGKTLTMSMLRSFLEMNYADPSDRGVAQALFAGLDVSKDQAFCDAYLGRWPVIFLSLKDVSGLNFDEALDRFKAVLRDCVERYAFLLKSDHVSDLAREDFRMLVDALRFMGTGTKADVIRFLAVLEKCLFQHCGKRVIILIDEYDVPLQAAYERGYYDEMLDLVRGFFLLGLKDSPALEQAVFTGCVRLSKESVFSGLNNFSCNTMSSPSFGGLFGFTKEEAEAALRAFGLSNFSDQVREHYDGYRFGGEEIYCPWTLLNFCKDSMRVGRPVFKDYWVNTSRNDLIRTFLAYAGEDHRDFVKRLLSGEAVAMPVDEEISFAELGRMHSPKLLASLLYCAGYLTQIGENEVGVPLLKIPNLEVQDCFRRQVESFFSPECGPFRENGEELARELVSGRVAYATRSLRRYLYAYASLRDGAFEAFYHGYVLGLLAAAASSGRDDAIAELESNAEAGAGFADILFASYEKDTGVVLEFKKASSTEDAALDRACDAALAQIKARKYYLKLRRLGLRTFRLYGVAFSGKECCLKAETLTADALP